jgi:hypothetical protein
MFPIAEATLSLERIAEYWSREIRPPASWQEIFHTLEKAWWLGEFRAHSAHSRLQFLKAMFTSMRHRNDLGIVFIAGDSGPLPVELPEGSQEVDLRYKIRVPSSNTETWDEAACRDAFQSLAEISSTNSYPEFAVGLSSIQLSYEEFSAWCKKRGFSMPTFWEPRDQAVAQQKRKTWRAKPGCVLSPTENAVLKVINELWSDGTLDQKANVRNKRIQDLLRPTQQSVSPRTIQRTLNKIHFA